MSDELKPFQVYCNEIELTMSPYDITLTVKEHTTGSHEIHGQIKISPQLAVAVLEVLKNNIAQYEDMFGKIPNPSSEKLQELIQQGNIIKK